MTEPRPRCCEAAARRVSCFGAGKSWLCTADSHRFGRYSWVQAMSHVIPLLVLQAATIDRWNCNVFGCARIMTVGNYVRICLGRAQWRVGLAAWLSKLWLIAFAVPVPKLHLAPMLCRNCRPPRRKMLKTGRCGRGDLRFGPNAGKGVSRRAEASVGDRAHERGHVRGAGHVCGAAEWAFAKAASPRAKQKALLDQSAHF